MYLLVAAGWDRGDMHLAVAAGWDSGPLSTGRCCRAASATISTGTLPSRTAGENTTFTQELGLVFVEGSGGPARGTRQQGAEGHPRNSCSHLQHLLLSPVPILGRQRCFNPHHEPGGRDIFKD